MILPVPRGQGPPQPPLLPPPAPKTIPKPPPPPSGRALLATDCSGDAYPPPRVDDPKASVALSRRAGRPGGSSFPMLCLGINVPGGGSIPLPPQSAPCKTTSSAPPPPPPEIPAPSNFKPPTHIQPQAPIVIPLEPSRFSSAVPSPIQQKPFRNAGTVLVLPPPCCPQQFRLGPERHKGHLLQRSHKLLVVGDAPPRSSEKFECKCPLNHTPADSSNAPLTGKVHQDSSGVPQCNSGGCSNSDVCHHAGEGKPESDARSCCGQDSTQTIQGNLRVRLLPSTRATYAATSHKLKRNDPPQVHVLQRGGIHAAQRGSPDGRGRRYRVSAQSARCKAIETKGYQLDPKQSVSQFTHLDCSTQSQLYAASPGQRRRKLSPVCSKSGPDSQLMEPPQIPPPPALLLEKGAHGSGEQCGLPSCPEGDSSGSSPVPASSTLCASSAGRITGDEESCFRDNEEANRDRSHLDNRSTHARQTPLAAEATSQYAKRLPADRWCAGDPSVKPCYSIATSSSGSSSFSTQGEYETGAGEWSNMVPCWHGTAEPPFGINELSWMKGDIQEGRETSFCLSSHSLSNCLGTTQRCAVACLKEALPHGVDVDNTGVRSCALQPPLGQAAHAQKPGTNVACYARGELDFARGTRGYDSVIGPRDDGGQNSALRTSSSSSALTISTRSGFARVAVLSPPVEAPGVDKISVSGGARVAQRVMGDEVSGERAGERETDEYDGFPAEVPSGSPWTGRWGTAARRATPQKLKFPGRFLEPSPCTATLSHLPPSPLTPLVLKGTSSEQGLPALLLTGEQQGDCSSTLKNGGHARPNRRCDSTARNLQGRPEGEGSYVGETILPSPAPPPPPPEEPSPQQGGVGAKCRRRKQNKPRRRLKEKPAMEESRERKQLHGSAALQRAADGKSTRVSTTLEPGASTAVERTRSPDAPANGHLGKPIRRFSSTVSERCSESPLEQEATSMPDCEAWASSPAVVARHIKSRRLLRADSERCSEYLSEAHLQREGEIRQVLEPDNASGVSTANACAYLRSSAEEHHLQAKCNSLFMPSSCSSRPSFECGRVTPQGTVLYTFELMDHQQHGSKRRKSCRQKQSHFSIRAQQRKGRLLLKDKSELPTAAQSDTAEILQHATASVLTLPTDMGILSTGCTKSARQSSSLCTSSSGGSLASGTSIPGGTERIGQPGVGVRGGRGRRCSKERRRAYSSQSRDSIGPPESCCRTSCDCVEKSWPSTHIGHHPEYLDGASRPGNLSTCSRSAGCGFIDSISPDTDPPTEGGSFSLLPDGSEVLNRTVSRNQEGTSLGRMTHARDKGGGLQEGDGVSAERRRGTTQNATVNQGVRAPAPSFCTGSSGGFHAFNCGDMSTGHLMNRRTGSFEALGTYHNGCRHVRQNEDAQAHHTLAMPQRSCATNRCPQFPARWRDGEVTPKIRRLQDEPRCSTP